MCLDGRRSGWDEEFDEFEYRLKPINDFEYKVGVLMFLACNLQFLKVICKAFARRGFESLSLLVAQRSTARLPSFLYRIGESVVRASVSRVAEQSRDHT